VNTIAHVDFPAGSNERTDSGRRQGVRGTKRTVVLPAVLPIAVAAAALLASGPGLAQVGYRATPVLQTTTSTMGQPLVFPSLRPQVTVALIELAPGGEAGRHIHPVPFVIHVLEGTVTLVTEGHPTRTFNAGQAFAAPVNHWHDVLNRSAAPVRLLAVVIGQEGTPGTIRP